MASPNLEPLKGAVRPSDPNVHLLDDDEVEALMAKKEKALRRKGTMVKRTEVEEDQP
jgi:hypothetical protein